MIYYAEKITEADIVQYVFNVQDYEAIFGLNESKIRVARSNFSKFLAVGETEPVYKVSGEFVINVPESEKEKIENIIVGKRKIANAPSKYNNEAQNYSWEDVKAANSLAEEFWQVSFEYDEIEKTIELNAESFEAWVSVITNAKKLAIASNEFEDKIADKKNG